MPIVNSWAEPYFVTLTIKSVAFYSIGFNLPVDCKPLPLPARVVTEFNEWHFHGPSIDWLSIDTGNPLSSYSAPVELKELLENLIDITKEEN